MRLVCPNCGAQYEVDDRVMPEEGRDVQCSNCGHAWFFTPPKPATAETESKPEPKIEIPAPQPSPASEIRDPAPEPEPEPSADSQESEDTTVDDVADVENEGAPEPEAETAAVEPDESDDADGDDVAAEEAPAPAAAAPRKEVSEEVKQILQEEAEQELRAREAESQGLETQPDLGLDASQKNNDEELAARIRRMEVEASEVEEEVQEKDLRSRDILPDIEEINSTLDAPDGPDETKIDLGPSGGDVASGGKGFRRGFSLTILLAVLLVCIYVLAPQISERFPQAQSALEQYTAIGDSVRVWLEGAMQTAIEKMRGLMDTSSEG